MSYCTACGTPVGTDQFCTQCGLPTRPSPTAGPMGPSARPWGATWTPDPEALTTSMAVGDRLRRLPIEMQAVCAAMALAGVLLAGVTLSGLKPAWQLLTSGSPFWVLGLVLLSGLVVVAASAVAMLVLAWRMVHGDRVARALSYILLGAVVATLLAAGDFRPLVVLVILGSAAALGVLALSPNVNVFFRTYPHRGDEPVAVVVARTLVAAWAALILLSGLVFLPLGTLDGKLVLIGLVLIGLAAGAFTLNARLARGDARARTLATVAAGIYVVLLLAADQWQAANVLPLSITAGVVAFLWVPAESKAYFGTSATIGVRPQASELE